MAYPKLFSKGKIGKLELKNRIVLPPMGTSYSRFDGECTNESIKYYEARAKGGCGLIITEITRIDDVTGIGLPNQMSITSVKYVKKLVQLVDSIHQYDCKVFCQLHHPGREVSSALLNGVQAVAPSAIACPTIGEVPKELTVAECDALIYKFIVGANIAKLAGFDGVELHAAHGYLINQFLSPLTNKRNDKYGGNYFKRLNFILNIIRGIQASCGPDFPISVRISADEFVEGGLKIEDSVKIARSLESLGIASINVSAGTYVSAYSIIEPQGLPEGWKKHLAKTIKENVKIPVIAVNNIKYPQTAENFLNEEVSDFIALGRAQISDPEWANKAKANDDINIRKCIGCMHCFKTLSSGRSVECTVNPVVGRELFFNNDTLKKDGAARKVVVIGAGPAGMHSAKVLAERGFNVSILEKDKDLGGTAKLAAMPPHKELLAELIKTQEDELKKLNVDIQFGTLATVETVKKLNPYGVVLAAGANAIIPAIEGINADNVITAEKYLSEGIEIKGKKVAVIGGGITGLETAELLAQNNKVEIFDMLADVGLTLYKTAKIMLVNRLTEAGAQIHTNRLLTKIEGNKVVFKDVTSLMEIEHEADIIILALGVRTNDILSNEFEAEFDKFVKVGDSSKAGQIADAMREANDKMFIF